MIGGSVLGIRLLDPVGLVSGRPVEAVPAGATVREAARRFRDRDVGMLVVEEDGELVGVLSERDITEAVADQRDPEVVTARDLAVRSVLQVDADLSVLEAATTMAATGLRHLLVRDADGSLGALSARDIVAVLAEQPDPRSSIRLT